MSEQKSANDVLRFDNLIRPGLLRGKRPLYGNKYELQIFGDESVAHQVVTYGLVAFADRQSAYRAQVAWNQTIKAFGAPSRSKVHARELFSGQARQKTCWSHLDERSSSELAFQLTTSLRREGAFCSVGVVHVETFPPNGISDGFTDTGEKIHKVWKTPEFYSFAFMAAALGLRHQIMDKDTPYKLWIDPLSDTIKLFRAWKSGTKISRFLQLLGLRPTAYAEEPQLLDAADLFSYAAARALSDASARNKEVCMNIYMAACDVRTDWWGTSENSMTHAISESITAPPSLYGSQVPQLPVRL